jgi:hypothetical protein
VHSAIEFYIRHLMRVRRPADLGQLNFIWHQFVAGKKGEIPERLYHEAKRLLERFASTFRLDVDHVWGAEIQMAVDAQGEPCAFDDEEAYVRGIADLITVYGETAHVCDWKSGWSSISETALRDSLQARTYALLLARLNPAIAQVVVEFVYPRSGKVIAQTFTQADADETWSRWQEIHGRVEQALVVPDDPDIWKPKPGPHCPRCPVILKCPLGMATAHANAGVPTTKLEAEEIYARLQVMGAATKAMRAGLETWIDEFGAVIVNGQVLDYVPGSYDARDIEHLAKRHFIEPMRLLRVDPEALRRVLEIEPAFAADVAKLPPPPKATFKSEPA